MENDRIRRPRRPQRRRLPVKISRRQYIGGMAASTTRSQIMNMFSPMPTHLDMIMDRYTKVFRAFCFATFDYCELAWRAIVQVNRKKNNKN